MDITLIVAAAAECLAFGLLLKWLHVQTRDNRIGLNEMGKTTLTKTETSDLIDLKLKPVEVGVANIQKEISELKSMVARLLDAQLK